MLFDRLFVPLLGIMLLTAPSALASDANETPHPQAVLKSLMPVNGMAARTERSLNPTKGQAVMQALEAAYGPADNGRGETLVWTVPIAHPRIDQASEATIMVERDTRGRYTVIVEDRAPRGGPARLDAVRPTVDLPASARASRPSRAVGTPE